MKCSNTPPAEDAGWQDYVYSEEYHNSVEATRKYLKEEFYEKLCGESESIVSCIGHTHIDVAWLWTVARTSEKAHVKE